MGRKQRPWSLPITSAPSAHSGHCRVGPVLGVTSCAWEAAYMNPAGAGPFLRRKSWGVRGRCDR